MEVDSWSDLDERGLFTLGAEDIMTNMAEKLESHVPEMLRLLGSSQIVWRGNCIDLAPQKPVLLLLYLALDAKDAKAMYDKA